MAAVELVGTVLAAVSGKAATVLYESLAEFLKSKLGGTVRIAPANDLVALSEQIRKAEQTTSDVEQLSITDRMLSQAHKSAYEARGERLRQARLTFNTALFLATLGTLLVLLGLILIFLTPNTVVGGAGALAGVVINVVSAIIFRLNKETNDRLDQANAQLALIEASQIAVQVTEHMDSGESRDDTFRQIALRIVPAPTTRRARGR